MMKKETNLSSVNTNQDNNTTQSKAEIAREIWQTLSRVDVNNLIERKIGKLKYISWARAWGALMEHYPDSTYDLSRLEHCADGSVIVWCTITVRGVKRDMCLAVSDHRHQSIISPTSKDIATTRVRCLTKCIAMFGLAHYIYAGEDLPDDDADASVNKNANSPSGGTIPNPPAIDTMDANIIDRFATASKKANSLTELDNLMQTGIKKYSDKKNIAEAIVKYADRRKKQILALAEVQAKYGSQQDK